MKKQASRTNTVAHAIGSLMVGVMMLDEQAKSSGSFISLKQKIIKNTSQYQKVLSKEQLEVLSQICYDTITELDTSKVQAINPATIVESLAFTFEKEMIVFYGQDFLTVVSRYSLKHGETAKDSYAIAKEVANKIRKYIFDRAKDF